jgi:hypothetical protein
MAAELAATTREWLHLLEQFERAEGWAGHGLKSCAHWLSWTCSLSAGTAREYLRVARALPNLPLIDQAFAAGRLSYSKVRAVVRVADRVDEQVLLDQALVQTVSQLERTVRQFRRLDGSGLDQQRRRKASWHWDDDGMLVLTARLPSDEGALLVAALERMRTNQVGNAELPGCRDDSTASTIGPDGPINAPDVNPFAFGAADSLVALAETALAARDTDSSGDDRHLLVLHADLDLLVDPEPSDEEAASPETADSDQPKVGSWASRCHLEGGPGLDLQTARRIACDAAIVAVLHHVGDGEPLRLGRKTRAISPAQRRALRIRDDGCRFPGCHRRRYLEAHHVRHWSHLGPTDLDNLVLVCRFHHMLVHEGGYRVSARSPGVWSFRSPDGHAIPSVHPAPAIAGHIEPSDARDPDDLLPGWAGEPFHLWATVAALHDNPRGATVDGADAA